MSKYIVLVVTLLLGGCASDGKSLLDRIEFDEDEWGCARVQGSADVGGTPWASSQAQILVIKKKDNPNPESDATAPDC